MMYTQGWPVFTKVLGFPPNIVRESSPRWQHFCRFSLKIWTQCTPHTNLANCDFRDFWMSQKLNPIVKKNLSKTASIIRMKFYNLKYDPNVCYTVHISNERYPRNHAKIAPISWWQIYAGAVQSKHQIWGEKNLMLTCLTACHCHGQLRPYTNRRNKSHFKFFCLIYQWLTSILLCCL